MQEAMTADFSDGSGERGGDFACVLPSGYGEEEWNEYHAAAAACTATYLGVWEARKSNLELSSTGDCESCSSTSWSYGSGYANYQSSSFYPPTHWWRNIHYGKIILKSNEGTPDWATGGVIHLNITRQTRDLDRNLLPEENFFEGDVTLGLDGAFVLPIADDLPVYEHQPWGNYWDGNQYTFLPSGLGWSSYWERYKTDYTWMRYV